ncbi:MAG: hypothetical protein ACI30J_08865 [Paludibacteraceae bacterium]
MLQYVKQLDDVHRDMIEDTANALLEMPTYYQVGGHDYFLYPPSIGTQMLITNTLKAYKVDDISNKTNIFAVFRQIRENKAIIARILAICSFQNRKDALSKPLLDERTKELSEIDIQDGIALVLRAINYNEDYNDFLKYYGIDKELAERKRIYSLKEENSSGITFGGLSLWGSFIDAVCSRYGWTMDYVLWGISAVNINMLLSDSITSVYLTEDEEMQFCRRKTINADDPRNAEKIRELLND